MKFKDGSMKVDLFTASAMTKIMDKVNPQNKKKMMDMINNGTKSQFLKLQQVAMKAVKQKCMKTFREYTDVVNPAYAVGGASVGPGMGQYLPTADLNLRAQKQKEVKKSDIDQL